jgi:hypothetical protein
MSQTERKTETPRPIFPAPQGTKAQPRLDVSATADDAERQRDALIPRHHPVRHEIAEHAAAFAEQAGAIRDLRNISPADAG